MRNPPMTHHSSLTQENGAPIQHRPERVRRPLTKADFRVPALLLALSAVPMLGGIVRLASFSQHTAHTAENARFLDSPLPIVVHIASVSTYCLLGAFQFSTPIRQRWPRWHRRAGKLLAVCGLLVGLTGLWMTLFYPIPTALQGSLLYAVRLGVGAAMVVSLVLGWRRILQRDVRSHEAWMIRAYALGQGAGTQVLILLPWMLISGESGGMARDLLMTLSWLINIVAAEALIGWRARRGSAKATSAAPVAKHRVPRRCAASYSR
jgi:hypothetical protein